jgi:hypothetical protein
MLYPEGISLRLLLLLLLLLAAHERNKLLAPIWMTTSLVGLPKKSHGIQSANNNNTKSSLQNFHLSFQKS